MDNIGLPLALIVLIALMSGWFVIMETSINESRHGRLERQADDGNVNAEKSIKLLDAPESPLATARIGFTLMSLGAGLSSTLLLPFILNKISGIQFAESIALAIAFVIAALFVLIIGVFLPKAAARRDPEKYLIDHVNGFRRTTLLMTPITFTLTKFTGLVMMLSGSNADTQEEVVTEDEVKDLIDQGTEDGTFEKEEHDMVDRVFQLGDETAYSLMTPRTQMVWLDLNDPIDHNLKIVRDNPQTIIPVGDGSLDECRGLLYVKDLLDAALTDEAVDNLSARSLKIADLLKEPMYVPRSMDTFRLLEKFRNTGVHEAMVLDEYGGVVGFITLDDILSEVIGTGDSTDDESAKFTIVNKNSWFVDGLYDIDDFKKHFDIDELPDEERDHYQTMGGFITSYFGYIPKAGESFEWNGLMFEVARMDAARVDKILVTKLDNVADADQSSES